jgi:hypothetical protein
LKSLNLSNGAIGFGKEKEEERGEKEKVPGKPRSTHMIHKALGPALKSQHT